MKVKREIVHGIILHGTIKYMILLRKSSELHVYICGLVFILIEPYSYVKRIKPSGIGATKSSVKESKETYAENIFQLLVDCLFIYLFCI